MGTMLYSSQVKDVRFNRYPPQVVFDLDETKPLYKTEYDDYNRLLFLDIGNTKPLYNKKINNGLLSYLEKVSDYKYEASHGFFLKLKKNIFHKVSIRNNPNRLVVDFSKNRNNKQYTIVIDPGHGGKDPGSIGIGGTREKDIVLSVGKLLREELEKDFNVVMTRDRDEFVSLRNRNNISNGIEANLFISIHANSSSNKTANGMEIFYFSKKSSPYASSIARFENSFGEKYGEDTSSIVQIAGEIAHNKNQEKAIPFADKLNTDLATNMKLRNRGIHGANFAVLRGTNSPGILVELGFIGNSKDHKVMKSKHQQNKMAKVIANNVRNYFY